MSVPSIYDDVSSVDLGEKVTQLQEQNEKLLQHKQTLENDIMRLCTELTQMKAAKDNLKRNISELFNTAKLEINRKDRIIADLQSQLDDLILRRKIKYPCNSENKELKIGQVSYKRNRDEATSESEANKRLKNEASVNSTCNVLKNTTKTELVLPHSKQSSQKFASLKHFSSRSDSRSPVRREESTNRRERTAERGYRNRVSEHVKNTSRECVRSRSKEPGHSRSKERRSSRSKEHHRSRSKERGQSNSREKDRRSHGNRNNSSYPDKRISKDRFHDISKPKDNKELKSKRSVSISEDVHKRHDPPLNKNTKVKEKIKPSADSKHSKHYNKPIVQQEGDNVKSKICSKEKSEKSNRNIDCQVENIKKETNVEALQNINKTESIQSIPLEITSETTSEKIKQISKCAFTNGCQENVAISADLTIRLESHSVNTGGTNEVNEEKTVLVTDKVKEIQINVVSDSKGDNFINQNVVFSNCVSDGQMVYNSQTAIKEESPNVIQSCNISRRESVTAKRRRRCVIKIVNQ